MPAAIPPDVVQGLEHLGASCGGDVPALIAHARAAAPPLADDTLLAQALELAGTQRAAAGDSNAAWWLSCALATVRTPADVPQQDEAEIASARFARALPQSQKAHAELPPAYRWIVAAQPQPPPTAATIELARRNAVTHLERLDAELTARAPLLRAQLELPGLDAARLSAVERALATYEDAAKLARAAVRRVVDHVLARSGGDPSLEQAGAAAIAELDDVVVPTLRGHVAEGRRLLAAFAQAAPAEAAPAAPASSPTPTAPASAPAAAPMSAASVDDLERAMRAAFEQAWASPSPQTRAAFEQAVRARYAADVANIADPAAREAALAHYVTHALAQLPQ